MNNQRRKSLRKVIKLMRSLQSAENDDSLKEKLREACDTVEQEMDAEQDCLDNLPENLQFSQRADDYSGNVDNLSDAWADIQAVVETYETEDDHAYNECKKDIEGVISNLTEAIER